MTKKRNEHVIGEKNTVVYVVVCHKQEELGYRFYSQGKRHQNCTVMKRNADIERSNFQQKPAHLLAHLLAAMYYCAAHRR